MTTKEVSKTEYKQEEPFTPGVGFISIYAVFGTILAGVFQSFNSYLVSQFGGDPLTYEIAMAVSGYTLVGVICLAGVWMINRIDKKY